jgi:DNA-binding transcriptional LysR family regulator
MSIELRMLRTFVEVVRRGGFTEAAKVISATQSTVSKTVKQLEDELGLQLIDRLGHRSPPAQAGAIVYQRALAMRDDLVSVLEELRGLKRGMLRIGVPAIGGDALFAPVFAAYRKLYPEIDIRLIEHGSAPRLQDLLRAGEIDLAGLPMPVAQDFDRRELRNEPLVALLARERPLEPDATSRLSTLKDVPFILCEDGFALNAIILDACRRSGFTPRVAAQSTQISFILKLVEAGLGVGFMPRMVAERARSADVRLLEISEPRIDWRMALAWRRDGYLSHAAGAWNDLAKSTVSA